MEWLLKLREALAAALSSGLPAKDPIWKAVSSLLEAMPAASPPPPQDENGEGDSSGSSGGGSSVLSGPEITAEIELVREDLVSH